MDDMMMYIRTFIYSHIYKQQNTQKHRSLNVFAQLGVARGQYTGLLPSLFRYAEISLTTGVAAPLSLSGIV
jgi:hypothetical protein